MLSYIQCFDNVPLGFFLFVGLVRDYRRLSRICQSWCVLLNKVIQRCKARYLIKKGTKVVKKIFLFIFTIKQYELPPKLCFSIDVSLESLKGTWFVSDLLKAKRNWYWAIEFMTCFRVKRDLLISIHSFWNFWSLSRPLLTTESFSEPAKSTRSRRDLTLKLKKTFIQRKYILLQITYFIPLFGFQVDCKNTMRPTRR